MTEPRAVVRNSADPEQVAKGRQTEERRQAERVLDWRAVVSSAAGQRVIADVLTYCRVFESVFSQRPLSIAFNSGRQDTGHFVIAAIDAADPEALFTILRRRKEAIAYDTTDD